jgi:hypothetical protein
MDFISVMQILAGCVSDVPRGSRVVPAPVGPRSPPGRPGASHHPYPTHRHTQRGDREPLAISSDTKAPLGLCRALKLGKRIRVPRIGIGSRVSIIDVIQVPRFGCRVAR